MGFFFSINIYQLNNTVPLNILDTLIAHHTPFNPRLVEDRRRAAGILSPLKTIPTTDGGMVFPNPLKAPAVVASIHIKSWDKPRILR